MMKIKIPENYVHNIIIIECSGFVTGLCMGSFTSCHNLIVIVAERASGQNEKEAFLRSIGCTGNGGETTNQS